MEAAGFISFIFKVSADIKHAVAVTGTQICRSSTSIAVKDLTRPDLTKH